MQEDWRGPSGPDYDPGLWNRWASSGPRDPGFAMPGLAGYRHQDPGFGLLTSAYDPDPGFTAGPPHRPGFHDAPPFAEGQYDRPFQPTPTVPSYGPEGGGYGPAEGNPDYGRMVQRYIQKLQEPVHLTPPPHPGLMTRLAMSTHPDEAQSIYERSLGDWRTQHETELLNLQRQGQAATAASGMAGRESLIGARQQRIWESMAQHGVESPEMPDYYRGLARQARGEQERKSARETAQQSWYQARAKRLEQQMAGGAGTFKDKASYVKYLEGRTNDELNKLANIYGNPMYGQGVQGPEYDQTIRELESAHRAHRAVLQIVNGLPDTPDETGITPTQRFLRMSGEKKAQFIERALGGEANPNYRLPEAYRSLISGEGQQPVESGAQPPPGEEAGSEYNPNE